jgi:malate synthase
MPSPNIVIKGALTPEQGEVLNKDVQLFLATLHRLFNNTRLNLLQKRIQRQNEIDNGKFPTFLIETENIRKNDAWKGPPLAPGLVDRRVEITGPVDRKMVINALNSGATQFMADFEDSCSPTWDNLLSGQVNLRDAVNNNIEFTNPNGKVYKLKEKVATLLVRPRGKKGYLC